MHPGLSSDESGFPQPMASFDVLLHYTPTINAQKFYET
jgi:hypothetical protein